jgi:hypothetical protein
MNQKEKIVTLLVLFLVRVLKPWQYDHQFDGLFKEIKEIMNFGIAGATGE